MTTATSKLILLAGPNGAGKSTSAPELLKGTFGVQKFVNADTIARGLSGFSPDVVAFQAGRLMLRRIHQLSARHEDFAFETTLASRSFSSLIRTLQRDPGYQCSLIYLWLKTPELAIKRVESRVRLGGHHVPEEIIRRRYHKSLWNFFNLYLPIVDEWYFYDNSNTDNFEPVAMAPIDEPQIIINERLWGQLRSKYNE